MSMYLAKVIGIGLIIIGAAITIRRDYFVPVFGGFVEQRMMRTIVSFIELMAGLFLIVGHNVWSPVPAAIITLLGWIAVIEGTAYLVLPDVVLGRFMGAVNKPGVYVVSGLLAVLVGLYLAGFGFGWW